MRRRDMGCELAASRCADDMLDCFLGITERPFSLRSDLLGTFGWLRCHVWSDRGRS